MKKRFLALGCAILISGAAVMAIGTYLKYHVFKPLGLVQDQSVVALPFLLAADPGLRQSIQLAVQPTEPTIPETAVTEPETEPPAATAMPTEEPPETTVPATELPETVPPTTVPPATTAPTKPPETVPPETVPPATTAPTKPPETVPPTTVPPATTAPTKPSETVPPTTVPPATTAPTKPPETVPPTTSPPATTVPTEPTETVPPTTAPPPSSSTMPDTSWQSSGISVDSNWYDDALFIGNSRTCGLRDYARKGNADYFCSVGMSVFNYSSEKISDNGFSKQSLSSLLSTKTYGKIFIGLGINECGYPYSSLISAYKDLVNLVREAQPNAIIILEGIMTVGEKKANSASYFQPSNIFRINEGIKAIADNQTVFYIDVNEIFADERGYLPAGISADGCHPYAKYYALWADWISYAVARLGL